MPRPPLRPRRGLGRGAGQPGARPLRPRAGAGPARLLPLPRRRLRPRPRRASARPGRPTTATPRPTSLQALLHAVEPPRQELFRRLNLAPGGTAALVRMREDLIRHGGKEPELRRVDDDFAHLFGSWFNRGFLVLRRIDWSTPADILERLIRYEAVHEIQGWDDLRRRVQPADRRCFGFFHPSLLDEPLIFVAGGAHPRDPGLDPGSARGGARGAAGRPGDDGRVLLDQQLPARPARRLVRQLPDQAGGRGALAATCRA